MKKNAFVSLNAIFLLPWHMLLCRLVCPTQCLLIGLVYVICIMGVAYKNVSMKSDFSPMPPSTSAFDSECEVFCMQLNLNEFKELDSSD